MPLDTAEVSTLARGEHVQILGEVEFPDWICRDPDTRVIAFSADWVWMEVVPELVEALTQGGQGMIHILDIGDLVNPDWRLDNPGLPGSLSIHPGATAEDFVDVLRHKNPALTNEEGWGIIGDFDALILSPWCEVRVFMPDLAFAVLREGAPSRVASVIHKHAWTFDDLLAEVGITWWVNSDHGPGKPSAEDFRAAVSPELVAKIQHNYGARLVSPLE